MQGKDNLSQHKYKVGEIVKVVANKSSHFFVLGEEVRVIGIHNDGYIMIAERLDGYNWYYVLNPDVEPISKTTGIPAKPSTGEYEVDMDFILEGYKEADTKMKRKIETQFPTLLADSRANPIIKEFSKDTPYTVSVNSGTESDNPLFVGWGMAPSHLTLKCLMVNHSKGWRLRLLEHRGGQQILVFEKNRI